LLYLKIRTLVLPEVAALVELFFYRKNMNNKVTINELAEMAHVAKSTVSKALNGQSGVSEEKKKQILKLAKEVKFEPNASARALAQNKTGCIGFVLPHDAAYSIAGAFWTVLLSSVAAEINVKDSSLLVITPSGDSENPFASLIKLVQRRAVDGLIIGSEQLDKASMMAIISSGIPFVFIGQTPVLEHYCIDVEEKQGAEKVVNEIISRGYKKIGCITGPSEYLYTQERIEGFQKAMSDAGLKTNAIMHTSYRAEDAMVNTAKFIEQYQDIDAFFITAGGDFVINILKTMRLSGKDLKHLIFGVFDDSQIYDFLNIPIITAKQPLEDMGKKAVEVLYELIDNKVPQQIVYRLPVEIILR